MRTIWRGVVLLVVLPTAREVGPAQTAQRAAGSVQATGPGDACPVTQPPTPPRNPPREFIDFLRAGIQEPAHRETAALLPPEHFWYGKDVAWLSLPSEGVLNNREQPWRRAAGQLRVLGQRLDGGAPVAVAHVPDGYGDRGLQSAGWTLSAPGCCLIVATVGDAELRFVARVSLPAPRAVTR